MRSITLWIFMALAMPWSARAEQAPPDDQARYLAGLPMAGTAIFSLSQRREWAQHATYFDKAWKTLEKRQLTPINTWMTEHLNDAVTSTNPLIYMFSGPDFLYAHAFFPNAATYVLCGIEPIGPLPDVEAIPHEALEPALAGLEKALNSVLEFSFFITKDMKTDLQHTRLSGTLPVLYTFLARTGCHLDDVSLVTIDKEGALTEGTGPTPGVRIHFTQPGHPQQTVYYFSTDLADYAIGKGGFLPWLRALGPAHSFAKAASYLMHGESFTKIRKLLLDRSTLIVQDDSGIPVRFFDAADWHLGTYGRYLGPLPIFKDRAPQPQLRELYNQHTPVPLSFSFGYRWHPSESTLLTARRLTPVAP